MRADNFLACKIGLNFVFFVLTNFDQYHIIGPKILVRFQNFKNIVEKNIDQFRIRKNIGQKNIGPFLKI